MQTSKKVIGKVSESERDEIRLLFERKNGLAELFRSITPNNEELYQKVVADMGRTTAKFQNWWDEMAQKYQWESIEGYRWEINFDDCDIFLVKD